MLLFTTLIICVIFNSTKRSDSLIAVCLSVIVILTLFFCFKYTKSFNDDYLSRDNTEAWRGLCSIIIIIHHIFLELSDEKGSEWFVVSGFYAVSVFFFFSGYGLQKRYMEDGDKYRKSFLLKRIPKILIPYIGYTALYVIMNNAEGKRTGINEVITSIINGTPTASYSWYIIDILIFYFVFYLLMTVCKKRYWLMILLSVFYIVLKIIVCKKLLYYGTFWYKTTHVIVVGMIWAVYEDKIISIIKKRYYIFAAITVILSAALYIICTEMQIKDSFNHDLYMLLARISAIVFVLAVMALSMRIKRGNAVLNMLGHISFDTYLSQGLVIGIFGADGFNITNSCLFVIIVLFGTVLLSFVLNKVFGIIMKGYNSLIKALNKAPA